MLRESGWGSSELGGVVENRGAEMRRAGESENEVERGRVVSVAGASVL